jgi:hypothetical protein
MKWAPTDVWPPGSHPQIDRSCPQNEQFAPECSTPPLSLLFPAHDCRNPLPFNWPPPGLYLACTLALSGLARPFCILHSRWGGFRLLVGLRFL